MRDAAELHIAQHHLLVRPLLEEGEVVKGRGLIGVRDLREDHILARIGHGIAFTRGALNHFRAHPGRGSVQEPGRVHERVLVQGLVENRLHRVVEMFE